MNELVAQLRAFFTRSSYLLTVGGLAALTSTPQITRIEFERAVLKSSQ